MSDAKLIRRAKGTARLAAAVALKGGQQKLLTFVAPWKPACDNPRRVYRDVTRMPGVRSVEVMMDTPCRRCARCLQIRQMKWRERALTEIRQANRTWAITLTFSPVQLAGVLVSADGRELVQVERRAYRDVQLYLKRLRKSGAVFRYLAVYERGEKSGRSHYHLLLHETGRFPVPKRVIEDTWPSHVHARLVDPTTTGSASYLTKYLTKDFSIRPRASSSYGGSVLADFPSTRRTPKENDTNLNVSQSTSPPGGDHRGGSNEDEKSQ